MTKEDKVYLKHISEAITRIKEYTHNITYHDFKDNHLVQDGVIRQITIIGEAVKLLSENTKSKNQSIPWNDIAGMRDKLIHGYFGVDIDAVWETVQRDIKELEKEINKLIK
ncbi:MAG: HepT-like ribonuclease domain-containing protein [Candidatus Odinarchaeia archaeon]